MLLVIMVKHHNIMFKKKETPIKNWGF